MSRASCSWSWVSLSRIRRKKVKWGPERTGPGGSGTFSETDEKNRSKHFRRGYHDFHKWVLETRKGYRICQMIGHFLAIGLEMMGKGPPKSLFLPGPPKSLKMSSPWP